MVTAVAVEDEAEEAVLAVVDAVCRIPCASEELPMASTIEFELRQRFIWTASFALSFNLQIQRAG